MTSSHSHREAHDAASDRGAVSLEWVLLNGVRTPVSAFAGLKVGRRPRVVCPLCAGELTLKLGPIRRHHAAHAAGSRCAATHPETALHINCKCYIATMLTSAIGAGAPLRTRQQCAVGNAKPDSRSDIEWVEGAADPCDAHRDSDWIERWDDVRVEFGIDGDAGRRVPDIVLMEGGSVVAAIEVVVSHAVDAEKAAAFSALGVPWIEVRGAEGLYRGDTAWSIDSPLAVAQSTPTPPWRCEAHEWAYATIREARLRVAEAQARAPEMAATVTAARLVDVYRPGGSWTRSRYSVVVTRNFGGIVRISLVRDQETVAVHLPATGETEEAFQSRAARLIQGDYRTDVRQLARGRGVVVDSPMRWVRGQEARNLQPTSRQHPRRFWFATKSAKWVRSPRMKGDTWPMRVDASSALRDVEEAVQGRRHSIQSQLEPSDRSSAAPPADDDVAGTTAQ